MLYKQVAVVSEVEAFGFSEVSPVSAALQRQVIRDFSPIWEILATVDAYGRLEDVPLGYWPIIIVPDVKDAAGVHLDKDGQPFGLVDAGPGWSLTASHECLEMLADPFGDRLTSAPSVMKDQGRVEYLVEVCDPSEDEQFGYTVNGVLVSDFYTPNYFDPVKSSNVRYSLTGAITEPRQVLANGYLSWHDPSSDHWWQLLQFGPTPSYRDLGVFKREARSIRSFTNVEIPKDIMRPKPESSGMLRASASTRDIRTPAASKAQAWRAQIQDIKRGRR